MKYRHKCFECGRIWGHASCETPREKSPWPCPVCLSATRNMKDEEPWEYEPDPFVLWVKEVRNE